MTEDAAFDEGFREGVEEERKRILELIAKMKAEVVNFPHTVVAAITPNFFDRLTEFVNTGKTVSEIEAEFVKNAGNLHQQF